MQVTQTTTKRLIYFQGHKDQKKSVLITQLCADCNSVPTIWLECASRTLANLYNLQTVRGSLLGGILDLKTSMSGPHHYYGYLNPYEYHTLEIKNGKPCFYREQFVDQETPTKELEKVTTLENSAWLCGRGLTKEQILSYNLFGENYDGTGINVSNQASLDSLFQYPGVLEVEEKSLHFLIIDDAYNYDLSSFGVQLVPNDQPFALNQRLVQKYRHAQHRLRVVTYNYGPLYVDEYLMKGSGIFVESHEFVQMITPAHEDCGGYVLIGRYVNEDLQLAAIIIPYGYTLIVDCFAIHGDSTLVGTYIMAMTGNHHAMETADTVYLKNKYTKKNVKVKGVDDSLPQEQLYLTSDQTSLKKLHALNTRLIGSNPAWSPVIYTPNKSFGWTKTIGVKLPR